MDLEQEWLLLLVEQFWQKEDSKEDMNSVFVIQNNIL
jgi:hypothetical protein